MELATEHSVGTIALTGFKASKAALYNRSLSQQQMNTAHTDYTGFIRTTRDEICKLEAVLNVIKINGLVPHSPLFSNLFKEDN